ncbi:hypothetical protein GCM10008995_23170 [Halobellus salinus]|uniref:Uncharacterized protein n=1 Tax=Halobellus salinus TaxID=931585 RepID=A0A830ECJ9_9EURY|nr:hypothetical protein [Halobellus salinus]GGJ12673.1 hypothetical protein GCM10008995_23170 [Halobellus salinus]SMP28822.1 hypothetical protein SAMN06265347_11413 [Halobellus salinus]
MSDAPAVLVRLPDGSTFEGPVVDLRGADADISPAAIRDAIRTGCPTRPDRPTVHAPLPTRVHRHVCHLAPGITVDRHAALAAVGAARGVDTPHCTDLGGVKQSLRKLSVPTVDSADLRAARRRAAAAGSATERLRERVATLRGRVEARRDDGTESRDDGVAEAEAALSEATRELSEASTERVAAAQRLAALEERARQARDTRENRLRLEDRAENLRRARRATRADAVEPAFHDARSRVESALNGRSGALDGGVTATATLCDALAIAAIAPLCAPVIVDPEVATALGGPDATATRLNAPLVIGCGDTVVR